MREVQTALLPFHLNRKTIQIDEGKTIAQVVEELFPRKISGISVKVMVDDKTVSRELWADLIPPVKSVVCINAIPAGGKGKNPLISILGIVVALAAVVAAPYLASAIAPELAGTGLTVLTGAIKIGLGAIGMLATSMLASAFSQSSKGTTADLTESTTQFIEGASNSIDRYGVIPVNLGTNRMFPKQAALPYTETSSNVQYVRQLFTYGYGNHIITERKFGDTLVSEYDEVEIEDKLNGNLNEGTSLYTNDVYQVDYSVIISNSAGYLLRTTQENTNEVDVDITFASGLTTYNDAGNRSATSVDFEIQIAPTGTSDWSAGVDGATFSEKTLTIPQRTVTRVKKYVYPFYQITEKYYDDSHLIFLNYSTGAVSIKTYTKGDAVPSTPANCLRIASVFVDGTGAHLTDERTSYIPSYISNTSSFIPSIAGYTLTIGSGSMSSITFTVTGATAQALRVSKRIQFTSAAQYDVRVRRITPDATNSRVVDIARLTAIRSIKNNAPVNQADISGTAIRVKATDQLNGTIDNYNVICSTIIPFYNVDNNTWETGVSSNPASLYRYVLQCNAFLASKRLPDNRINLTKLEEWAEYCEQRGLTYNRVIDYDASIDDVLADICAAGMATKHYVDGIYSVIIDNERDTIKGLVTPRNSWGYKGTITYPELPHAFRVQFRNPDIGYEVDERLVYQDDYDESNATDFERLEVNSCTDPNQAFYYGRRYLACLKLQPETHTFSMDFENLAFNRGDRIQLVNDVILVGVGQGRINSLIVDSGNVTGFTIDETVEIPNANVFGVRIRHADASGYNWYELITTIGETNTFTFATPVPEASAPPLGSLCAFTEFGKELDLIVTSISLDKNHNASITALNYAPARFSADTEEIPDFNSNVTFSLGNLRPNAPILNSAIVSDESVMSVNSDGSFVSRMVINLTNTNESTVVPFVRYRKVGETSWYDPDILSKSANTVVLTGLEDGSFYDIQIRYQRQTGQMLISAPLELNGIKFVGASALPSNVTTFRVSVTDSVGLFEWSPVSDIDLSHYIIKFTRLTEGASWDTAQLLKDNIVGNNIALPIQEGTYLLKAVDLMGNESADPVAIISYNSGSIRNVVENLVQQSTWTGVKDNCHVIGNDLYLIDPTSTGYYYFDPATLDLSEIYESYVSSSLQAYGSYYFRVRSSSSIRSEVSMRGTGGPSIRSLSSIRATSSIRGINQNSWSVKLQVNTSSDGTTWSGWNDLVIGNLIFRYIKIRIVINSTDPVISPRITIAEVKIDMPDRQEYREDMTCPSTGVTITYAIPFKNNPAVNITLQDSETDDRIEYTSKTSSGFGFKVYNKTSLGYVERTFDYTSLGYGRVIA